MSRVGTRGAKGSSTKRAAARVKAPASPPAAACRACGASLTYAGVGRRPVLCDDCDPHKHRRPRAPVRAPLVEEPSKATRDRRARAERESQTARARAAGAVRRLAIALRLESDPRRVAALAGVEAADHELAELIAEASGEAYAGLRESRATETSAMLSVSLALGAARLTEAILTIPPSVLPSALQAISKAQERLGGEKLQFPNIIVHMGRCAEPAESPSAASFCDISPGSTVKDSDDRAAPHGPGSAGANEGQENEP